MALEARDILNRLGTLGFVGFMPVAPGTWATLLAVPVVWLLNLPPVLYIALTAVVFVLGIVSSNVVEEIMGRKDPGCIVIDEFAGYMIAMAFLPHSWGYLLAAFILFRIFDILKPPPLGWLQNMEGGLGVMLDDVAAGVLANLSIQLWLALR